MELALSLEKLTNEKLLNLHKVSLLLSWTCDDVKLAGGVRAFFIRVKVFRNANPWCDIFSCQLFWAVVYVGPIGSQQEQWCAVGRFRWKRVFTWAGKAKLSFYLLLWLCFHSLRRMLYDLKSAMSIVCHLQVEAIKKISEYVAQLRRVGKGHGRNRNKIS